MGTENKLILLMTEEEAHIFTTKDNMTSYLLANDDEEMNMAGIEKLIQEGVHDTMYASYSWDYCPVD